MCQRAYWMATLLRGLPQVFGFDLSHQFGGRDSQRKPQANERRNRRLPYAALDSRYERSINPRPKREFFLRYVQLCTIATKNVAEDRPNILYFGIRHAANVAFV